MFSSLSGIATRLATAAVQFGKETISSALGVIRSYIPGYQSSTLTASVVEAEHTASSYLSVIELPGSSYVPHGLFTETNWNIGSPYEAEVNIVYYDPRNGTYRTEQTFMSMNDLRTKGAIEAQARARAEQWTSDPESTNPDALDQVVQSVDLTGIMKRKDVGFFYGNDSDAWG